MLRTFSNFFKHAEIEHQKMASHLTDHVFLSHLPEHHNKILEDFEQTNNVDVINSDLQRPPLKSTAARH